LQEFADKLMPILRTRAGGAARRRSIRNRDLYPVSQLGSARRLEIIYDTNMRMSFSAGTGRASSATRPTGPI
jgi:hypothetical protein